MRTTVASHPLKDIGEEKILLQIRVLRQDKKGTMHDVTQVEERNGYGLKDLQDRSAQAHSGLIRTRELLQLLAFAAEHQEQVDAALVRRVLVEVETELSIVGELGSYVRYTEELFEDAMALPWISGIKKRYADRLRLQAVY